MTNRITTKTPVIISAQSEHLHQADPEGDQEGSAILWLCGVLFAAVVVVILSALWVALQATIQSGAMMMQP